MSRFWIVFATLSCVLVSCRRMERTNSGLEYKIFNSAGGKKAAAGDLVYFKLVGKCGDSTLFDSKGLPYSMLVGEDSNPKKFEEGLKLMGAGDSALIRMVADSFYTVSSQKPAFIKSGDWLEFYIKVDSFVAETVLTERVSDRESEMIASYVENSTLKFTKTESGLYYSITKSTKGPLPSDGDLLGAKYSGKQFNGRVFDSNTESGRPPIEFVLGGGGMIRGWDEGFHFLREGEKATFLMPSSLAYGPDGNGPIGPYSPLIFEVELVSIKKATK